MLCTYVPGKTPSFLPFFFGVEPHMITSFSSIYPALDVRPRCSFFGIESPIMRRYIPVEEVHADDGVLCLRSLKALTSDRYSDTFSQHQINVFTNARRFFLLVLLLSRSFPRGPNPCVCFSSQGRRNAKRIQCTGDGAGVVSL